MQYQCPDCDKTYSTTSNLARHRSHAHPNEDEVESVVDDDSEVENGDDSENLA